MSREALSTLLDAGADNVATALRTTEGRLHAIHAINPNSADAFIQFFDVAAASVVVGTTVPKLSFLIPAGNGTDRGAFDAFWGPLGIQFGTAITYACTTTATGGTDNPTGPILNLIHGGP